MAIFLSDQQPEPEPEPLRLVGDVRPLRFAPPTLDRRPNLFDAFLIALGWLDEAMTCVERGRLHESYVRMGQEATEHKAVVTHRRPK